MKDTLHISQRAFWDTDFSKLDKDLHKTFIIERVFNYGKWNDILHVISYYGEKDVTEILLNAEFLTEEGLDLASAIFKLNKNRFKCYSNKRYRLSSTIP